MQFRRPERTVGTSCECRPSENRMDRKRRAAEIVALERDLQNKIERRDELNQQILHLQEKIMELSKPSPRPALDGTKQLLSGVGLTEAIRMLMREHGQPMTEADVVAGLGVLGFNLKRFISPPSVIHNALLRMASAKQLQYRGENRSYALPAHTETSVVEPSIVERTDISRSSRVNSRRNE